MTLNEALRTIAILPGEPDRAGQPESLGRRTEAFQVLYQEMTVIARRLARRWREPPEAWDDLVQTKALVVWADGLPPSALECGSDSGAAAYLTTMLANLRRDIYDAQVRHDRVFARSDVTVSDDPRGIDRVASAPAPAASPEDVGSTWVAAALRERADDPDIGPRVAHIMAGLAPALDVEVARALTLALEAFVREYLRRAPGPGLLDDPGPEPRRPGAPNSGRSREQTAIARVDAWLFRFVGVVCRAVASGATGAVQRDRTDTFGQLVGVWAGELDVRDLVAGLAPVTAEASLEPDRRFKRQRERLYKRFERMRSSLLSAIPGEIGDDPDPVGLADFLAGVVDLFKFRKATGEDEPCQICNGETFIEAARTCELRPGETPAADRGEP